MFSIILDPMYFLNQNNGSSAHCRRHYLAQHAGLIQDSPFPELSIPPETGAEMDGMALCTLHTAPHCTLHHTAHCHIAVHTASLCGAVEQWESCTSKDG